jgi:hypothetical protein
MRNVSRNFTIAAVAMVAVLFLIGGTSAQGPGTNGTKDKPVHIQAQAFGQAQQLGRTFSVNLIIEEYSTVDDQKALFDAFNAKKNEGLVNALSKMKTKGRMAITGTLGYDVTYIKAFAQPDGSTKLRMVTNRPITFGEAWSDSRSSDYNLSGVELILTADGKKNSGTLFPACQFKLDKEGQIQLELLQNAWRLADVRIR